MKGTVSVPRLGGKWYQSTQGLTGEALSRDVGHAEAPIPVPRLLRHSYSRTSVTRSRACNVWSSFPGRWEREQASFWLRERQLAREVEGGLARINIGTAREGDGEEDNSEPLSRSGGDTGRSYMSSTGGVWEPNR
jgi:hypothetical protein